ncbi:MAG: hypothetical protein HY690_10640 [Chloroflexi bacterium]|nr:hypothetical protein [Chloroflexota bacterium]
MAGPFAALGAAGRQGRLPLHPLRRKKRGPEALSYNRLVQSWPEIALLACEGGRPGAEQTGLFEVEWSMNTHPELIERYQFETQQLMMEHPPIWRHRNKQIVFEIACPPGSTHRGRLDYSRWRAMRLPLNVDAPASTRRVAGRAGFYDYVPALDVPGAVEWHVNFADPHLFVAYGSSLFAQDEMQVAEHPSLGALKEALDARGISAVTVENRKPTPVLVMGVERRCRVATDPNVLEGRPRGLYGNQFVRADAEAVIRATTRLDPPTITNLIAMAAPSGGYGRYSVHEIEHVLVTAFTAFRAAVLESTRCRGAGCPVVIHTGFWGCGAFGGNRVLMATLQVLAAEMAGVDGLVFHTGDGAGAEALEKARSVIEVDLASGPAARLAELIARIASSGFEWGVSDGT